MIFNKKMIALYWDRIIKEKTVWILGIVCLYAIIAYYYEAIRCPSLFYERTADIINNIALGLSYSYFAAMLFYILNDFLPQTKKAHSVLMNAAEEMRQLKEKYQGFGIEESLSEEEFISLFTNTDTDTDSMPIRPATVSFLKENFQIFDTVLLSIMSIYGQYLSDDDFSKI